MDRHCPGSCPYWCLQLSLSLVTDDRLADFDINVAQSLSNASQSWQDSSRLCLHHPGQIGLGSTESLNCSQPVSGRYVTLILPTSDYPLHFCEMEVLGVPAVLTQRTNTYRNQPGHQAPGDVISETYVRSVIDCTSTCSAQDGCTAVNLQTASNVAVSGGQRLCRLLDYGGGQPSHCCAGQWLELLRAVHHH